MSLIDTEDVLKMMAWLPPETQITVFDVSRLLKKIPIVEDLGIRQRGQWDVKVIKAQDSYDDQARLYMRCSCCRIKYEFLANKPMAFNYCPNCGAKMDGGEDADADKC